MIEEHALESLRKQRSGKRRNAAAGAALGGLLGGKKGGAGAAAGTLAAIVVNSVIRSQYSKEQEKEADLIGTELALAQGFDPDEAARFWDSAADRIETRSAPDPSEPMEAQGVRRAGRVVRAGREGRAG